MALTTDQQQLRLDTAAIVANVRRYQTGQVGVDVFDVEQVASDALYLAAAIETGKVPDRVADAANPVTPRAQMEPWHEVVGGLANQVNWLVRAVAAMNGLSVKDPPPPATTIYPTTVAITLADLQPVLDRVGRRA